MPPVGLKGSTLKRALANERLLTARMIAERPTIITVRRAGVDRAPQTVRIEPMNNRAGERFGINVAVSEESVIVLGHKGDSAYADLDIKRGDRFFVQANDAMFEIVQVIPDTRASMLAVATLAEGT